MKKHLVISRIPLYTPEWFAYRRDHLNGSELGGILGLSPYTCKARVFHEKLGTVSDVLEQNEAMFHGTHLEEYVADKWQYYDFNEPLAYIENFNKKNLLRKKKNIGGSIVNPKYPWLSITLDRVINKGGYNLITGDILKEEVPLEIKNLAGFVTKKWTGGIPAYYHPQLQAQMMVLEVDYAEIAIMVDGRNISVLPIIRNTQLCSIIEERCSDFWYNTIVPAKELALELNYTSIYEQCPKAIQELEPEADETEAYEEFIKEKYRAGQKKVLQGTDQMYEWCVKYKQSHGVIKEQEKIKQLEKNRLLGAMGECSSIDFGELGRVVYNRKTDDSKEYFGVNTK